MSPFPARHLEGNWISGLADERLEAGVMADKKVPAFNEIGKSAKGERTLPRCTSSSVRCAAVSCEPSAPQGAPLSSSSKGEPQLCGNAMHLRRHAARAWPLSRRVRSPRRPCRPEGMCVAELLYGAKDGVFQYDKLISLQSKTADGLVRAPPPADADHAGRGNEPQRPSLPPAFALQAVLAAANDPLAEPGLRAVAC